MVRSAARMKPTRAALASAGRGGPKERYQVGGEASRTQATSARKKPYSHSSPS